MGFLELGSAPLQWGDIEPLVQQIKRDGLEQLLHLWNLNRNRSDSKLYWGDELEFTLLQLDHEAERASLCLDAPRILDQLNRREKDRNWHPSLPETMSILMGANKAFLKDSEWHPEYGNHMIEATPLAPYAMEMDSILEVEHDMASRRFKLQSILPPTVFAASVAAFPRFTCGDSYLSINGKLIPTNQGTKIPGTTRMRREIINPHPRFGALSANMIARRNREVTNSIQPASEPHADPNAGDLVVDHLGCGMSLSCLQVTFGCPNLSSARYLYDQLAVWAPIFLALSASTPVMFGYLTETDTRWNVLEMACDDRTSDELKSSLKQTRYGAAELYIGSSSYVNRYLEELNDLDLDYNVDAFKQLMDSELMDSQMAKHFARLWKRDPLSVFGDKVSLDNSVSVDHFENIQSTNWNSVRFKVPHNSPDGQSAGPIPWRVELRTPDIQLSDFANAALATFSAVLTMAILEDELNFYIPISQVHENLKMAQTKNSVTTAGFWFRKDMLSWELDPQEATCKMSLRDIFLGCRRTKYPGIIPYLNQYVSGKWRAKQCSRRAVEKYRLYSNFLTKRVLGQAWTDAGLMRHLITTHPTYERDSLVNERISYGICKFAVLGGFGLVPQVSPWGIPGCMPSSVRLPGHANSDLRAVIASSPLLRKILPCYCSRNTHGPTCLLSALDGNFWAPASSVNLDTEMEHHPEDCDNQAESQIACRCCHEDASSTSPTMGAVLQCPASMECNGDGDLLN